MAVSLAAQTAWADPTAADVETARALYVEGLELRDKGDTQTSLQRFRAAHALAATPITSLELGRAHVLVGQLVEARDVLLLVDRLPQSVSESPKAQHARGEAKALAEQLRTRIPSITITFAQKLPRTPRVSIDGAAIPAEALTVPRKVNPGKHTVFAELGYARGSKDVSVVEGETKNVVMELEGAIGEDNPPPPPLPPRGGDSGMGTWFYVGLAAAGVGAVAGGITGAVALSTASSLEKECTGSLCPRTAQSDLDTSRTMGTIATISFIVAGAGVAVAVVAWLAKPGEPVRAPSNALRWSW